MFKPEQDLISIHPQNELKFEGPFNLPVTSWIRLTNITDKNVYYKLKTTAPKRYCVRPNSGFMGPKASVEVQILLQPFAFNPAEKNKHKFMIQSVLMPEGSLMSADELWKCINPEKIMNYKLKCVFESPANATTQGNEQEPQVEPVNQVSQPKAVSGVGGELQKAVSQVKKTKEEENIYQQENVDFKSPLPGLGGELQKAASEVKQLREEESKLRQENIALKEEILRLRHESGTDNARHSYSPPTVQQSALETSVPLHFIFISIVVAIFALFLGKFVL